MIKPAVILLLVSASINAFSQSTGPFKVTSSAGSENINPEILQLLQQNYLDKIYYGTITAPNELINGKEYIPYFYNSGTNPLLFVNRNRTATLFFRDMQFRNISLQYDTYRDEVIYSDNNRMVNGRYSQIALNNDNIRGFNLYFDYDSMIFINFRFPVNTPEKMKDGYYEVAYDGKSRFLIKHKSSIYNKEGRDKYEYSTVKYILSGARYVRITSKNSFLKIFGEREKEISGIIKKSNVKINSATSGQIAEILKYFDSSEK